jgi:hypothetical protein
MESIPIKVECHAGFKADEYPKRFIWDGVDFEIVEIIDRWYEAYGKPGSTINYFKVKTSLKGTFMLKHETERDRWFLVV